jgi:hypothetical protein
MAYEDLLKDTSVADPSNNYFTLTITDLNPNTNYPIQLRWKYKDGTFSNWGAVKRLPAKTVIPAPPSLPSVPTLKRVVGAIQISWDGKTSNGANQPPTSFVDAEIYISTTSDFTPTKGGATNNYIDILDFADNQNTLNIGVGTVVNPTFTIDYGIDYYVKIRARNSENVYSSPVTANGSPIKVGQLSDAGLIEVKADKITTGTLQSNSTITVGATSGKHVIIRGTGNPLSIYGSGGTAGGTILDFDETGNLSIKGTINATSGAFTGAVSINGTGGSMKIGKSVGKRSNALGGADPSYDGVYIGTNNYWYNDGFFEVGNGTKGLLWNGSELTVKGNITATGGNITGSMDVDGQLDIGNVTIKSVTGNFSITETGTGYGIISTSEAGRLVLGHNVEGTGRQVKVARSAQIAGNPSGSGAENSGGLRNIFTSTVAQFYSNAYLNVNEANGDVVLLYTP